MINGFLRIDYTGHKKVNEYEKQTKVDVMETESVQYDFNVYLYNIFFRIL